MILIPAIDLKDGRCVRLQQGDMSKSTIFSEDPVSTARKWMSLGCERLHLVDLNGAFAGEPINGSVVQEITKEVDDVPIQIGGGVRSLQTIEYYLEAGAARVILGTKAINDFDFVTEACGVFPGKISVGLDARDGRLATDGWSKESDLLATEYAKQLSDAGVSEIIYTDIERDGMMQGVNIEATVSIARASDIPVIASGGICDLSDIENLLKVAKEGILGAITGRAIYEGTLDFQRALRLCQTWVT